MGTLAVRYVVRAQNEKNTVLRIDAVFVEDFRHISHASNGSVESAEYKDIHDQLEAIQSMKAETAKRPKSKSRISAGTKGTSRRIERCPRSATAPVPAQRSKSQPPKPVPATPGSERDRPARAQRTNQDSESAGSGSSPAGSTSGEVSRRALKSAPFHTASTLQSLPTGTEVLIVISTTYWLGVETHDGQHGWIMRDELELMP